MPATESTWYNQFQLNRLFAISGVLLTVLTVVMFYKDHAREWKTIQPNVVKIDTTYNQWRQEQFDTTDALQDHERLMNAWSEATARPLSAELLAEFRRRAEEDAKYRQASFSFTAIETDIAELDKLSADAVAKRIESNKALHAAELAPEKVNLVEESEQASKVALAAEERARAVRERLIGRLQGVVDAASVREVKALGERKFQSARLDAAKASLDIAIRDSADVPARQEVVDKLTKKFDELTLHYQRLSSTRMDLGRLLGQMVSESAAAQKAVDDGLAALTRLQTAFAERQETWVNFSSSFPWVSPGKKILNLPIIDAFGSRRKIDNLWADGLEQDYNFRKVRRFDRCTTCHQSMAKTIPGDPTSPLLVTQRQLEMILTPPAAEEMPKPKLNADGSEKPLTLEDVFGIRLADKGLLNPDDVTIKFVLPKSPGAKAQLVGPALPAEELGNDIRLQVARLNSPPPSSESNFPNLPGLMLGDVITYINGDPLVGNNQGAARVGVTLLDLAKTGKPIRLTIRRGLPNPYASHPRLDLFISDSSPHRMEKFGCTVCHEGQGSATDFKWASHTPNTPDIAKRWSEEYGWFDNHHWIYPMNPQRFVESSCLKCHHEVVELEPSERFPDAPAAKLVHGYELIRKYGCFGCHEITGFDGPNRRVGPDLRLEPNYFAAGQILADMFTRRQQELEKQLAPLTAAAAPDRQKLNELVKDRMQLEADLAKLQEPPAAGEKAPADKDQQVEKLNAKIEAAKTAEADASKKLEPSAGEIAEIESRISRVAKLKNEASELVAHPELNDLRHRIRLALEEDARKASQPEGSLLTAEAHQIGSLLKDVETPGVLRKVGPSLRHVAAKLDRTFMYDWINDPKNFRPNTRMPRFFGLWNHFPKNEAGEHFDERAARFEPIEIRGAMEFLLKNSQPYAFESPSPVADKDQAAKDEQIARGKMQFETRGCLACHTHKDFPDTAKYRNPTDIVQGPDLSSVGTKFSAEQGNKHGPEWLYSWLKNPSSYNPRTLMPNLFLDVESTADGKQFDPADDIKEYLLSSTDDQWKPAAEGTHGLDAAGRAALHDLTLDYLREAFYSDDAERYVKEGIAPELRSELKGAEQDLIRQPGQNGLSDDQMLLYIGRKTITKYGCYGCHDIPGFEDAKPIGTGLADWGRKDPSKLAFEHILHLLEHHGHAAEAPAKDASAGSGHGESQAAADEQQVADEVGSEEHAAEASTHAADAHDGRTNTEREQDQAYYLHAIESGNRIGFLNQKLKAPRSYDFEKTGNKRYNERLRMPQFSFTDAEREAIMTFVLGLVADPPREKYVYTPDARQKALMQGQVVLEKFNCRGCHILETERWNISYAPGSFGPQQEAKVFPFLITHFGSEELEAAGTPNRRNQLLSSLRGLPTLLKNDGLPYVADEEGVALEPEEPYDPAKVSFALDLYQPTILDGQPYQTGQSSVLVQRGKLDAQYPTSGGLLTSYLLPRVTQLERQVNSNASGAEAYGWLPPPLVGEGTKVQTAWLHDFLLDPYPIRPAVFLRMPKFNMSSDETSQLVDYFAARDNASFPYEFSQARQESHLTAQSEKYVQRLKDLGQDGDAASRFDAAMKIVVDNNYCVKCHQVADFMPQGSPRARAPNLADVYRRLRPEYVRHWIANPKMILPYTSMPVNVPYDPAAPFDGGVKQELYHGTSTEQVDALVDLLMNFDRYAKQNTSIADKVPKPAETPPAAAAVPKPNTQTSTSEPARNNLAP